MVSKPLILKFLLLSPIQKLDLMLNLCEMESNCCSTTPIVAERLHLLLGGSNCYLTPSIVRKLDLIVS